MLCSQGEQAFRVEGDHALGPFAVLSVLELVNRQCVIELMSDEKDRVLHHVLDLGLLLLLTFHTPCDLLALSCRLQHQH